MRLRRRKFDLEADDLGVDWERWADGRAFRLKRKRDFADVEPGKARNAAEAAAARMGKVVLTTRDKQLPRKFVWIQFADAKIKAGEPCPKCGSTRLLRVHRLYARCPECGAFLLLAAGGNQEKAPRAERTLRELSHIHLASRGQEGDAHVYRGHALLQDSPVFVLAHFSAKEEEGPVTVEDAFERVTNVQVVPYEQLDDFADTSALERAGDWDLEL